MEFNIRSPYYITKSYGGLSPCIQGNNAYGLRPFPGSVLVNCVGWASGRYNQLIFGDETPQFKYLGNRNAVDFTKFCDAQGLKCGNTPVKGACMVWGHGEGHVAIVEEVIDNDTVKTSESGWSYRTTPLVRNLTRKRGKDGRWGYSYDFITFIYPPQPQPPTPPAPIYYTVKRGDTLTKIAKMFNTTVAELVRLNNIKNPNLIITGDVLLISGSPEEPIIYKVKLGDTLTKIANKYGTTVKVIAADNHIKNVNLIVVGQKLIVYRGKK